MNRLLTIVLIIAAALIVTYFIQESDFAPRASDASGTSQIVDADGRIEVFFKEGLNEESRNTLLDSGALETALEMQLSMAAKHPIQLQIERKSDASVVFAFDLGEGRSGSIPTISVPRTSLHIDKGFDIDLSKLRSPGDILAYSEGLKSAGNAAQGFEQHTWSQMNGRIPLTLSEKSTFHPSLPSRNLMDLSAFVDEVESIRTQIKKGRYKHASPIPKQDALLLFGNGSRGFGDSCLAKIDIPYWVPPEELREEKPGYKFPPVTQPFLRIYVWPKRPLSDRIEQWSRKAKARGLKVLIDGWIVCSFVQAAEIKAGDPMSFPTSNGNSSYLGVCLLQSLGLLEIKVLP